MEKLKRFVVRKYVMAKSAQEALRKERALKPDEVFVDDTWIKEQQFESSSVSGFRP